MPVFRTNWESALDHAAQNSPWFVVRPLLTRSVAASWIFELLAPHSFTGVGAPRKKDPLRNQPSAWSGPQIPELALSASGLGSVRKVG